MENQPSAAVPHLSFAVEYQDFTDGANLDFSGKGTFVISTVDPFYSFTGASRVSGGRESTLKFWAAQIWNVTVSGRKIEFRTSMGMSGAKNRPFVFFCATAEEAVRAAQLLPPTQDHDALARQDFGEKLRSLPFAASPWTSVTNLLIATNVAAFVVMGFFGAGWFETASMKPYVLFAANNAGVTTDGEWWRILTCMFVHYGLIHLLLNMWALFQTGHFVERLLGRSLFTLTYFGSGIVAGFTSIFWHKDTVWSAGASGAVFGVYGVLLGFMLREKHSIPSAVLRPLMKSTLTFAGYNLLFGLMHPQIDNSAHVGGLGGGLVLGWLVALPIDREIRERLSASRLRLGLGVLAVTIAVGTTFSPRFDYHLREELKWDDVVEAPAAKEADVLNQLQGKLTNFRRGQGGPEFQRWLESETIPFYETWLAQLKELTLTPALRTDRRRQAMVANLEAKLSFYHQLVGGVQANDVRAVDRYVAAMTRVSSSGPPKEKP